MNRIKYYTRQIVMKLFSSLLRLLSLMIPKKSNLILFGSFSAERFGENSAALYLYITKEHPELKAVWMTNTDKVFNEIDSLGGVVLKRRSIKGIWKSLRAFCVVSSHGIKDAIMYEPILGKPKLIYLGHGIPLKKGWIGIEHSSNRAKKASLEKIKYSELMIATSKFSAQLQNNFLPIGKNRIKITGLPRNDIIFKLDQDFVKKKYSLDDYKFLVLYAPTFRTWEYTRFFPFDDLDLKLINEFCQKNSCGFILRPHHSDLENMQDKFWDEIRHYSSFKIITHEDCSNVNELLVSADCLITDYSSIFFDYLLRDKPIIFLPYDQQRYEQEHGFIVDYKSVTPGLKPSSQKELLNYLNQILNGKDKYAKLRNELKDKVHKYKDGNSCLRITNIIKDLAK